MSELKTVAIKGQGEAHKASLLKQVQAILAERSSPARASQAEYFAQAFLRRVPGEELRKVSAATAATVIGQLMKFAGSRPPGEARVRVFNPDPKRDGWTSKHTIVEMVNDDMPFIVDTANLVLAEMGITVHRMVHPVVHIVRDKRGRARGFYATADGKGAPESIIHMEIDRQGDESTLEKITQKLETALGHVRAAVEDWPEMVSRADEAVSSLEQWAGACGPGLLDESREFLEWIRDDHFIFLGARDYTVRRGKDDSTLDVVEGSGLGLLRESGRMVRSRPLATLADGAMTERDHPLIVTKTRARSTVHRGGYMDYIGVLQFDRRGRIVGERRFIGLFTSNAYFRRVKDTPLLRPKVERVLEESNLRPGSHARKSLVHILETLPRDDLLQASVEEISSIAHAVLNLQDRKRVRLLVRRERFSRFFSALVFIPRDHFNTENRERIQDILKRAYQGETLDYEVRISESPLARLQVIIRPKPGADPQPDVAMLEQKLVDAVRSWHDHLADALVQKYGEDTGLAWADAFGKAFPAAYVEDVSPWVASYDVERIASLEDQDDLQMSLYRPRRKDAGLLRFKLFKRGRAIPLSEVLPILENLGLKVLNERPYQLEFADGEDIWVQDYDMTWTGRGELPLDIVREPFIETFEQVWRGVSTSDGFNRLVLACRLDWRQVKVLRAYCKYLLQTGMPFSLDYMATTMARHPVPARLLVELFEAYFDPARDDESDYRRELAAKHLARDLERVLPADGQGDSVLAEYLQDVVDQRGAGDRAAAAKSLRRAFRRSLNAVRSIDEDRILQAFFGIIRATLRTNGFQLSADGGNHDYISFKFDSSKVPELPRPRPYREIWVFSPRVEGIHLRMGPIARGGLRWSDRPEDFRTEVLGLMKAQNVKNTMIVPVGAKGGFVPRRLPETGGRDAVIAEGTACYRVFINALLDITDNLDGETVVPPKDVVRRDPDDPYLVVAADKGTATFSDIANGIAQSRGFWLGDAFASGGSVGYDHKGMGITAKGAWEGVKRHFREMGTDIQSEPFTVVGIGDMSGDVFGNGMLLSKHIRLRAAFNHLHIFIDPQPDEAASYRERRRLFRLPRSSWTDYDPALISEGGGVFSRQEKSVPISRQVREWLSIEDRELSPDELISALLKAPVDLLWNGGIGTYVKSSRESNADVGDLANNPLRVNGGALRCRVVGEGGNLGMTQLGRIEYARAGGRVNTDFIDNSAGVDCSDHEVNIKILLEQAREAGTLSLDDRNALLAAMTDEVSDLVLRSNYLQTQAISMMERLSADRLGAKQRFISVLEDQGLLDRDLEYLPDDDELTDRRQRGEGLLRPELSVLLSYAKIRLYQELLDSDVPEDPFLSAELPRYFPEPLREPYGELMLGHRLKREIVATQVTNSLVNRMGVSFVLRMREDTGASAPEVARAYTVARELLDARDFWQRVEAADNKVAATVQLDALLVMWQQLRQVTRWVANRKGGADDVEAVIRRLQPGFETMQKHLLRSLHDDERARFEADEARYVEAGFAKRFSRRIAMLPFLPPILDVVETSVRLDVAVGVVADVYRGLGDDLSLRWLRVQVERLGVTSQWQAQARGNLRDELFEHHRELAEIVIRTHAGAEDPLADWKAAHAAPVERVVDMMADMRKLPDMDYATVSVAVHSLDQLLTTADG